MGITPELSMIRSCPDRQLYFHISRYMLKEVGRAHFLLPKVKVEFRQLSSFKNGLVFALPIKLNQISLFFAD
jgi:hypothetical protein